MISQTFYINKANNIYSTKYTKYQSIITFKNFVLRFKLSMYIPIA